MLFPTHFALDPGDIALKLGEILIEEGRGTDRIRAGLAHVDAAGRLARGQRHRGDHHAEAISSQLGRFRHADAQPRARCAAIDHIQQAALHHASLAAFLVGQLIAHLHRGLTGQGIGKGLEHPQP
ncbi:MAG: hypothetical protein EBU42_10225 [Synechococcus sp.]|nr:hypothetical protein [Synechococcus sp.]